MGSRLPRTRVVASGLAAPSVCTPCTTQSFVVLIVGFAARCYCPCALRSRARACLCFGVVAGVRGENAKQVGVHSGGGAWVGPCRRADAVAPACIVHVLASSPLVRSCGCDAEAQGCAPPRAHRTDPFPPRPCDPAAPRPCPACRRPPRAPASNGGMYPIALLVEELKSEDPEVRIGAMRRLTYIGKALGPDRCRSELIPFLNGMCVCACRTHAARVAPPASRVRAPLPPLIVQLGICWTAPRGTTRGLRWAGWALRRG